MAADDSRVVLPADTNQALGLGKFTIDFMSDHPGLRGEPDEVVIQRTGMFHTDAVLCGASAIALGTNAPTILRNEALQYRVPPAGFGTASGVLGSGRHKAKRGGVPVFGSHTDVYVEKAIAANVSAVREWDSNGTNFGYSPERGPEHQKGEFGHNDYYAVPVAAAQLMGRDGKFAMKGVVLVDEIRGRLAEVFSLKTYTVDHVLHGAIASAAVSGAMTGATAEEIESAIGMVVAHAVPFRAIRHGHQLSDSKGASAAISTEFAILSMKRAMAGFVGPGDIFRNPEAVFNLFEGRARRPKDPATAEEMARGRRSPFDLHLTRAGRDFTVMGMHFKLGLYEHQSAGALQGLIDLIAGAPGLLEKADGGSIRSIVVKAYEPAFGIIGDPHKRDPRTRQSADHSMLYLVCTMLRKAIDLRHGGGGDRQVHHAPGWRELMLMPRDFDRRGIMNPLTRRLMEKTTFEHGGPEYDAKYPDGIPTSVVITDDRGNRHDSGLVMYPAGHARNTTADLKGLLSHKWEQLGALATDEPRRLIDRVEGMERKTAREVAEVYGFEIRQRGRFE